MQSSTTQSDLCLSLGVFTLSASRVPPSQLLHYLTKFRTSTVQMYESCTFVYVSRISDLESWQLYLTHLIALLVFVIYL